MPFAILSKWMGWGELLQLSVPRNRTTPEVSSFSKQLQISDVKVDDYILVRFTTKSTEKFYIGQMMEMDKKIKKIHTTFVFNIITLNKG